MLNFHRSIILDMVDCWCYPCPYITESTGCLNHGVCTNNNFRKPINMWIKHTHIKIIYRMENIYIKYFFLLFKSYISKLILYLVFISTRSYFFLWFLKDSQVILISFIMCFCMIFYYEKKYYSIMNNITCSSMKQITWK